MIELEFVKVNEFFKKLAQALDIPDLLKEEAILKYDEIGEWLADPSSPLNPFNPEIYPQGSFNLGTIVRPISDDDDFDIDLVCNLALSKYQTTQENLKEIVGNRLKEKSSIIDSIEESRRCWRLNFQNDNNLSFHMDVLPSIDNKENPPTGILITDTDLIRWQKSNPKAYAEWFYERMKIVYDDELRLFAKASGLNVEEVPKFAIKTPLQYAIKLLKRHRDVMFANDNDNKPISIIITTLAAKSYKNQTDIFSSLREIVHEMPKFIEKRGDIWWVPNPVDIGENFADKWNEYPSRQIAFFSWLERINKDLSQIEKFETFNQSFNTFQKMFGDRAINTFSTDFGYASNPVMKSVVFSEKPIPELGDFSHCQETSFPVQIMYKASIIGKVHRKQGGKNYWPLTDRTVPKNVWLEFNVKTDTPSPYSIQWQVVNTGTDAIKANCLRGSIFENDDQELNTHWETTNYLGTHWIEAFVIKNGVCVARTGRKYVKVR